MRIRLGKYEALGNDFLVLVDAGGASRLDPATVRQLCERRRGVGADGLLRLRPPPSGPAPADPARADLVMELTNADGGPAETSGNGLRCAVLAASDAGLLDGAGPGTVVRVATGAGVAEVEILALGPGGAARMVADLGKLSVSEEVGSPLAGTRAFSVDVGNPHLVLVAGSGRPEGAELAVLGPALERSRPGGVNVELVRANAGGWQMEVWERGAGLTLACGSGSCAAAAAVRAVGLAGDVVEVANPGGVLLVHLDGPPWSPAARLEGPVRRVAFVDAEVDAGAGPGGGP